MVPEVDLLALLPGAVLDVEDADEVGRPAAHEAVEELEDDPGRHAQLREGVGQRQQHLRHLVGRAAEPRVVHGPAVPEQARQRRLAAAAPPRRRRRRRAAGLMVVSTVVSGLAAGGPLHLHVVPGHDRLHLLRRHRVVV